MATIAARLDVPPWIHSRSNILHSTRRTPLLPDSFDIPSPLTRPVHSFNPPPLHPPSNSIGQRSNPAPSTSSRRPMAWHHADRRINGQRSAFIIPNRASNPAIWTAMVLHGLDITMGLPRHIVVNLPWWGTTVCRMESLGRGLVLPLHGGHVSTRAPPAHNSIAIRNGAWSIAKETTLGIEVVRGLPLEWVAQPAPLTPENSPSSSSFPTSSS